MNSHRGPKLDHARGFEEYAKVKGVLAQRTDGAILFDNDDLTAAVWIPRRALDLASKLVVEKAVLKSDIEISVELKMAMDKGLV